MAEDDARIIGTEAAEDFRRRVDQAGALRVQAGDLMTAFGLTGLEQETRESVADMLWDVGLRTEPSLGGARIRTRTKLRLLPVDAAQVSAAVSWQQTPGERGAPPNTGYAINPVGVGIAAVGGLLLALASFLPLDELGGQFAYVRSNTLIQHGEWWLLIGAVAIIAAAYRSYSTTKRTWDVPILGVLAAGVVLFIAQNKSLHTLVPAESTGLLGGSSSETMVPFGIAVYVASAGALLTLIGGWVMRQTAEVVPLSQQEASRRCPDCAETILAAAHVCKHCGARLDAVEEPRPPYPPAPAPQ